MTKKMSDFLNDWKHIVLVLGLAFVTAVIAIFVPDARWEHLGNSLAHFLSDPTAAAETATAIGTVLSAFWAAFVRVPPRAPTPVPVAAASDPAAPAALEPAALEPDDTVPSGPRRSKEGSSSVDLMFGVTVIAFVYNLVCELFGHAS